VLNSTAATADSNTRWNDTLPTSTVFSLGTEATVNASGATYVAYLFAHDAGGFGDAGDQSVVKCGSFTGNGSTTGPVIDLGWEPQWLLIKRATVSTGDWLLFDNMRLFADTPSGDSAAVIRPNSSTTEGLGRWLRPLSTGFQPLITIGNLNESGSDYIYIAIRRGPMKTPTDATEVFAVDYGSSSATIPTYDSGFPVDLGFTSNSFSFASRLTGARGLATYTTAAESSNGNFVFDSNVGWATLFSATQLSYMFRRAPGFFDVVAYTGTGSGTQTLSHNLSVAPEFMIARRRNSTGNWETYHKDVGAGYSTRLNGTFAAGLNSDKWGDTAPTSSVFTVGADLNGSYTHIAYLFGTVAGVSKVGSYTGTGTTLNIDCGFTAGARFVLIKRTDSTGDWYVWDTARGIVSGNDPYLLLNSTAAEVTSTDYIDPLSSGFQISSTAPAAINASGGSFIFLAIA
jgi:hypothetical protein